jgi:hypothetical protein
LDVYEAESYPLHREGGHLRGPSTAPITGDAVVGFAQDDELRGDLRENKNTFN